MEDIGIVDNLQEAEAAPVTETEPTTSETTTEQPPAEAPAETSPENTEAAS